MPNPPQRWLTAQQIAAYTGHHYQTIYLAMRAGELRATQRIKKGSWRADIADVDAWVQGIRPQPHRVIQLSGRR